MYVFTFNFATILREINFDNFKTNFQQEYCGIYRILILLEKNFVKATHLLKKSHKRWFDGKKFWWEYESKSFHFSTLCTATEWKMRNLLSLMNISWKQHRVKSIDFTEFLRKNGKSISWFSRILWRKILPRYSWNFCQRSARENFSFFRMHHWVLEICSHFLNGFDRLHCILFSRKFGVSVSSLSVSKIVNFTFSHIQFTLTSNQSSIKLLIFLKFWRILEKRVTQSS